MSLPFSAPRYLENPREQISKSMIITCYGLCTECLEGVFIDNNYWLEGFEASSDFYLISDKPNYDIPYDIAVFYSDCLSFEHEIPTLAKPKKDFLNKKDIPWNIKPKERDDLVDLFFDHIDVGIEEGILAYNGLWQKVVFKYDQMFDWLECKIEDHNGFDIVKVNYYDRFNPVKQGIHLYNAALKQIDIMSKYLCYYRVIEFIAGNNGKEWIEDILDNTNMEYYGKIWIEEPSFIEVEQSPLEDSIIPNEMSSFIERNKLFNEEKKINILEIMRANALFRFKELKNRLSTQEIAERLYNDNRCGIAHGRNNIRRHDLGDDFIDILNDLKLIKYLARIAIDERIK